MTLAALPPDGTGTSSSRFRLDGEALQSSIGALCAKDACEAACTFSHSTGLHAWTSESQASSPSCCSHSANGSDSESNDTGESDVHWQVAVASGTRSASSCVPATPTRTNVTGTSVDKPEARDSHACQWTADIVRLEIRAVPVGEVTGTVDDDHDSGDSDPRTARTTWLRSYCWLQQHVNALVSASEPSDSESFKMQNSTFTGLSGRWMTNVDVYLRLGLPARNKYDTDLCSYLQTCSPTDAVYLVPQRRLKLPVDRLVTVSASASVGVPSASARHVNSESARNTASGTSGWGLGSVWYPPAQSRPDDDDDMWLKLLSARYHATASGSVDSEPRAGLGRDSESSDSNVQRVSVGSESVPRPASPESAPLPVTVRDCDALQQWWASLQASSEIEIVKSAREMLRGKHIVLIGDSVGPLQDLACRTMHTSSNQCEATT